MRKTRRKPHTFNDWINKRGVPEIAKLLKVNPSTIRHWRLGYSHPRVDQMRVIKRLTRGQIGYDQIIDGAPSTTRRG